MSANKFGSSGLMGGDDMSSEYEKYVGDQTTTEYEKYMAEMKRTADANPYPPVKLPRCCLTTGDPGKWTAGVNNSADDNHIGLMHGIRNKLSYNMPLNDFIWALKSAVGIDSRTMLGGDIQRCLLSNAAHRLEIMGNRTDPDATWSMPLSKYRFKDAWAVLMGRAAVIYVKSD
jgi:hypothetical protein